MNDRVPYSPDKEESTPQKGHEGVWIEGLDFLSDTNYIRMASFLGLTQREREDTRIAEKVSFLSDWAGVKGNTTDETRRKAIIKRLWNDLGVSYMGEDLVTYLYRYARLDEEAMKLKGEMDLYRDEYDPEAPAREEEQLTEKKIQFLTKQVDDLLEKLDDKPKEKVATEKEDDAEPLSSMENAPSTSLPFGQSAPVTQPVQGKTLKEILAGISHVGK